MRQLTVDRQPVTMANWRPLENDHQKINNLYEENLQRKEQGSDAQGYLKPADGDLKPPAVYILNHEEFPGKPRKGSANDVEALTKTFKKLKCKVEVVPNPTRAIVHDKLKNLTKKKFDHPSGLVIVILSHGSRREQIQTCDNKSYNLDDDVLFPLFDNESLSGKPKILIVQACKGSWRASMESDSKKNQKNNEPYIKCYSSSEGFLSYRNESNGSIFIQTLCDKINQDGMKKDFRSIIEDVKVSVQKLSISQGYKQTPSVNSNLTKRFCFGDFVQNG